MARTLTRLLLVPVWVLSTLVLAPGAGACPTDIELVSAAAQNQTVGASLTNPSGQQQSGYLVLHVLYNGQAVVVNIPLTLNAGQWAQIAVRFQGTVSLIDASASQCPGGGTESPDPVTVVVIKH